MSDGHNIRNRMRERLAHEIRTFAQPQIATPDDLNTLIRSFGLDDVPAFKVRILILEAVNLTLEACAVHIENDKRHSDRLRVPGEKK